MSLPRLAVLWLLAGFALRVAIRLRSGLPIESLFTHPLDIISPEAIRLELRSMEGGAIAGQGVTVGMGEVNITGTT